MKRALVFISFLSLLAGCVRPLSYEQFVRSDQATDGVYSFDVDMSDSLSSYTVSFYSKVDRKKPVDVPLQVLWTSPSGKEYSESVYMKMGQRKGDREVYRSSLVPNEFGDWTICVTSLNDLKGFRGIGIIVQTIPGDGTR